MEGLRGRFAAFGGPQVSAKTEPWNPSAEPWGALREADRRYDGTPEPMFSREFWEGIVGRLSGMGWRLAPAYRGEGKTGAEIMADPPEWPVPEGDYREYISVYGDLTLRVWLDGTVEVLDDEATVDRWEGVTALSPSPVLDEPEGKVLVDREHLRIALDTWDTTEIVGPEGFRAVNVLRRALDGSPAPVPVEEPEAPKCRCCRCGRDIIGHPQECPGCGWTAHEPVPSSPAPESYDKHEGSAGSPQTQHNSAPEIKVGQDASGIELTTFRPNSFSVDGQIVQRMSAAPDGDWVRLSDVQDMFAGAPSLDLEGLAKLDAEIAGLRKDPMAWRGKPDWTARQVRIDALSMAREWLVKEAE